MNGRYKEVRGFIARAADTAHLKTYDEVYDSLQLNDPGSAFHPETDECLGLIRFKIKEVLDGARLYEVRKDGALALKAIYNDKAERFVSVK